MKENSVTFIPNYYPTENFERNKIQNKSPKQKIVRGGGGGIYTFYSMFFFYSLWLRKLHKTNHIVVEKIWILSWESAQNSDSNQNHYFVEIESSVRILIPSTLPIEKNWMCCFCWNSFLDSTGSLLSCKSRCLTFTLLCLWKPVCQCALRNSATFCQPDSKTNVCCFFVSPRN